MIPIGDSQKPSRFPLITFLLIFLNVAVFIIEITTPDFEGFISAYAFTPSLFSFGNIATWWPIITAAFLHGGFTHILFNMLFLWVFGDNVEDSLGSVGYILFYLGATCSAGLLQYVIDPHSTIPMLGASGAIAGILGYYLVVFPSHRIKTLLFMGGGMFMRELPAQIFLAYWTITQFLSGFGSLLAADGGGGTAWFAHIGGLLFGALIGFIATRLKRSNIGEYEIVRPF